MLNPKVRRPSVGPALDVDGVLRRIGEFGPWQRRFYAFTQLSWAFSACQTLLFTVANNKRRSEWACARGAAGTACVEAGGPVHLSVDQRCELPRASWYFVNPTSSVTAEFGLVCANEWLNALCSTVYFFGFLYVLSATFHTVLLILFAAAGCAALQDAHVCVVSRCFCAHAHLQPVVAPN